LDDVNNADVSSAEYIGELDVNSFDPCDLEGGERGLRLGETYYWRVDEVNDSNSTVWKGLVWRFNVEPYLLVDDFEYYDDDANMHNTWKEDWRISGNSGATISLDTEVVGGGSQSMKYIFENDGAGLGADYYSEIVANISELPPTAQIGTDWELAGVAGLILHFHGLESNATTEDLYVGLEDGGGKLAIVYYGDSNDLIGEDWQPFRQWNIDLMDFKAPKQPPASDINLGDVRKIYIGFGDRDTHPNPGGTGTVYLDDLRLYRARCVMEEASVNFTWGDCYTDFEDVKIMTYDWLNSAGYVSAVAPDDNNLIIRYDFNETSGDIVADSADYDTNVYDGSISDELGTHWRTTGKFDGCLEFDGGFRVNLPVGWASYLDREVTLSYWMYGDENAMPANASHVFQAGETSSGYTTLLGVTCPNPDGGTWWSAGYPREYVGWYPETDAAWEGQWNHYALVKNADEGAIKVYLNGRLVVQTHATYNPIGGLESAAIGGLHSGWGGAAELIARVDELRIYNYALSQEEIVYLAEGPGGQIYQQLLEVEGVGTYTDVNGDGTVNTRDFALVADKWLQEDRWP
jgi:hypothetical protein